KDEAAAQVAARPALDLQDTHGLTGRASQDVGEQPRGEEAARAARAGLGVRLDPVRALEGTHAGVQVLVGEPAPATGREEVGQAAPEDGAGGRTECVGGARLRGVLAASGATREERVYGIAGGESGLLECAGGLLGAHLLAQRPAQRGEGGDGKR